MSQGLIEKVSKDLSKLPTLGPRASRKIILELCTNKEKNLASLIENLNNLYQKVHECQICHNLDEGENCEICLSNKRNKEIICIIEEVADLWAVERVQNYNGLYHVLGGKLSAAYGVGIEDLNIESLHKRLKDSEVKEVIIATSATIDGQTTAHFLTDNLKEYDLKITHLAYGIPIGSELDYLDEGTIDIAFKTRREF
jgi:recombination protein RecR